MDCMEKEFEEYWNKNQKRLILNAPKALRDEYIDSTKLDSPIDWVCFILPVALGIGLQPVLNIQSEILSWAVVLLIVVVCFGEADVAEKEIYHTGSKEHQSLLLRSIQEKRFKEIRALELDSKAFLFVGAIIQS